MPRSEFGRRASGNTSLGAGHGTEGPMLIAAKPVKGGQYGRPVNFAERATDDNLVHTTDFRRGYATVIDGWLGVRDEPLLRGRFESFAVFA